MFKMMVGISLMMVVAELFLSESSFKKYVRSIIGVLVFAVIVEGIFSVSIDFDKDSLLEEAERLSDKTLSLAESDIANEYETQIKTRLERDNICVLDVHVRCDMHLNLTSITVTLEKKEDEKKARNILVSEFGIDEKIIIIIDT